MSEPTRLPSLDSAWSAFEREDLGRQPSRYELLLRELERRAPLFHLEPHLVGLAAELACFPEGLNDEEQAALTLLTLCTLIDLARGSTRTPCEGLAAYEHLKRLYEALAPQVAEPLLTITRRFLDQGGAPEVIGRVGDEYCPLLRVKDHLYHQRLYAVEGRLIESIQTRIRHQPNHPQELIAAARADVEARPAILPSGAPIALSSEQGNALELAASRSLAMISGGPGTGKTSIVVALLRVLVRVGISIDAIELAAPTGKAAWRMGESIRNSLMLLRNPAPIEQALIENPPTPQTLHRLLAYHPRSGLFRRHRNAPISAEVVIIDESSMIDIYLMERLLGALKPETQLIFLGDAHQLPSVSAGAVFKDLLGALSDARCTLTQSYRMREDDPDGREILTFAQHIREGADALSPASLRAASHITAQQNLPSHTQSVPISFSSPVLALS
jgi:exodeoxyribonuclease V alpha subunit